MFLFKSTIQGLSSKYIWYLTKTQLSFLITLLIINNTVLEDIRFSFNIILILTHNSTIPSVQINALQGSSDTLAAQTTSTVINSSFAIPNRWHNRRSVLIPSAHTIWIRTRPDNIWGTTTLLLLQIYHVVLLLLLLLIWK